jgi:hypothetical protein
VRPTDSKAERRCALGALIAAAYQLTDDHGQAHEIAISAIRPLFGSATLVNVNDVRVMLLCSQCSMKCWPLIANRLRSTSVLPTRARAVLT